MGMKDATSPDGGGENTQGVEAISEVIVTATDGRRMAVRVMPHRSRTHLVILDVDNHPWFFTRTSLPATTNAWIRAVADFTADDQDYSWDTPRYRQLCLEGGLNPDHHRPRFFAENDDVASALIDIASRITRPISHGAMAVVLDLIDLLRVDPWATPVSRAGLRAAFASLVEREPLEAAEVMDIVSRATSGGRLIGDVIAGDRETGDA